MTITTVQFQPGVNVDDTTYSAKPQWVSMSGARFHRGGIEIQGGYVQMSSQAVRGRARGIAAWADNSGKPLLGIGTHNGLFILTGGQLYTATPFRATGTLAADPIATFSGDTTVLIADVGHGFSDQDQVMITGATTVGGLQIGGTQHSATDPFTVIGGLSSVIVMRAGHGLSDGDMTYVSGASAVGGITLSGLYSVSVIDADTFSVNHSSAATSSAMGGGSVTFDDYHRYTVAVVDANIYAIEAATPATSTATGGGSNVVYYAEIPIGNQDGGPSTGYGSGRYGTGVYGLTTPFDAFAMTWSMAAWGQDLAACPRGRRIYIWQPSTQARAQVLSAGPTRVDSIFRTPEKFLVALGCEYLGNYDPMLVRHSDVNNYNTWAPAVDNAARFQPLVEGSRLIAGRPGNGESLIWSDTALYAMRFVGDPDLVYRYDLVGTQCGLIGPNAAAVKDGRAAWMTPDKRFCVYDGGTPRTLECDVISASFGALAQGQEDKVYCWINSQFNEVTWGIPTADTGECAVEVTVNLDDGLWYTNTRARTIAVDAPLFGGPVMVDPDGAIWLHEQDYTANGGYLEGYARTSPFDLSEGDTIVDVLGLIPDIQFGDTGTAVDLYLIGADYQEDPSETEGPYTATQSSTVFDTRTSGRRVSLELRWTTTGFWRMKSQIRLNLQEAGRR